MSGTLRKRSRAPRKVKRKLSRKSRARKVKSGQLVSKRGAKRRNKKRALHASALQPGELQPAPLLHPPSKQTYEEGIEEGRYLGGDRLIELCMPPNTLLPAVSASDVINFGVKQLLPNCIPLLGVMEVYERLQTALVHRQPFSLVRLGDGELLALSQGIVYDPQTVLREGPFLSYAGIEVPDYAARDLLAAAVREATLIGVPLSRRRNFQPLLHAILPALNIPLSAKSLTVSTINYELCLSGRMQQLLQGRKLLVIGNVAPALADVLTSSGYEVTGLISPVRGFADIDRVIAEASVNPFELALVAAGIPAVVIVQRIATQLGKAAIDFGHLADQIVSGQTHL